jgi:hypothetical protein
MAQIKPCAGGLGEALIPRVGGLGGRPPSWVFLKNNYLPLKSVPFELSRICKYYWSVVRAKFLKTSPNFGYKPV